MRLGIIGCGNISETYFECQNLFNNFKIVACSDINFELAKKTAEKYNVKALSVDDILSSQEGSSSSITSGSSTGITGIGLASTTSSITDGDVSGVISVGYPDQKIDIYLGIGGAPEGVLAAAALKCLDCQMQGRLYFQNTDEKNRAKSLGITDFNKKYNIKDMVKDDVIFCATGVTDGEFVNGIKDQGDLYYCETLALHSSSNTNTIIKNTNKK